MSSVFETQKPARRLLHQIHQLQERLEHLRQRLEGHIEAHREQIRLSLSSGNPIERDATRRVAAFWHIPILGE